MRLISKNAGFGFNLSVSKAPLASPGTITNTTIVANQTNTYSYEWFQTDAAGNLTSPLPIDNDLICLSDNDEIPNFDTQYFKNSDYYYSKGASGIDFRAKNYDSIENLSLIHN